MAVVEPTTMANSVKADDFNTLINDVPELTEDEKITLISAMKKAQVLAASTARFFQFQRYAATLCQFLIFRVFKSFSTSSIHLVGGLPLVRDPIEFLNVRPLEGQLYKYTNVVKGWQYRWFILIPETGILEYYVGAVISPSDEDGQSFAISAACGELYKLKANDPKERQFWVNRIRAVAEHHTKNIAEKNPPLPPREHRSPLSVIDIRTSAPPNEAQSTWYAGFHSNSIIDSHPTRRKSNRKSKNTASSHNSTIQPAGSVTEALNNVRDMLRQTESLNALLCKEVEALPHLGNGPKCCDTVAINFPKTTIEYKPEVSNVNRSLSEQSTGSHRSRESSINIDPSGEISDNEEVEEKAAAIEGDRHSIVMNLMTQLKLGADLTNVTLPSFVLEPRSLLEMFADSFRHPDMLVRISDCTTTESRMVAVVQWFLTSFHASREPSSSKKPYNPIIGEMFRCSWNMHEGEGLENLYKVTYVAEQVSHHPPISAFYVECPKKKISVNAHICVKSNFLTSYAAINFTGEVSLHLLSFDEIYVFTLPCAYLRCILTVPWIELGGRVSVTCATTGYNASIMFQTKPQQSGIPHKVSGEIKHLEDVVYRISGEWNNILQFTSADGVIENINVQELKRFHKHVRPLEQQDVFESRRLWQHVTKALLDENYDKATTEKQKDEHTGRPWLAVILDNGSAIQKLLMDDNRCTYQMIQKKLNIGSAAIHKIIHEELYMKKVVCLWIPYNLTDRQKVEHVRISKETLKLQNDGNHCIIFKIVIGNETYILFFDIPTHHESKIWVVEDDSTPTMMKTSHEKSNVCCFLQKYKIGHQVGRTEDKIIKLIEEEQREEEKKRLESNSEYVGKLTSDAIWVERNVRNDPTQGWEES
ncbi:oxysterol-binding protein-related protein 11 [Trichonephila clavipes]|nr:oxysterol-binding protein-related protein 11 [Trichonephila clavipes]